MKREMTSVITLLVVSSLVMLLLTGCGSSASVPNTAAPSNQYIDLLAAVEGKAQLKREGWKDYAPIGFGALIRSTDLIRVDGKASVLCADLSVKPFSGQGRTPCPANQGWLEYNGMRFDSSTRAIPQLAPYILYPRNTVVMEARPVLRWHATGVTSYTVSIVSGGKTMWSQSGVTSDTLRYPADAPALQPGVDYLLMVQDNATGHISTEDPAKGLGFRVLGEADRKVIEQRRGEIMGLSSLDEPARQLALAVYYASLQIEGRGMWGEAWTLLDSVARTKPAPAVYLRQGDVLAAMRLTDKAETAYTSALQSAQTSGDVESQAVACVGLWRVTGDATYRDQAIEKFKQLGDEQDIKALQ